MSSKNRYAEGLRKMNEAMLRYEAAHRVFIDAVNRQTEAMQGACENLKGMSNAFDEFFERGKGRS